MYFIIYLCHRQSVREYILISILEEGGVEGGEGEREKGGHQVDSVNNIKQKNLSEK
jgi:hypothetical protein